MKKIAAVLKLIFPLLLLVLLIYSGDTVRQSCAEALGLCGRLIVPSLFPFFVLSSFINSLALPGVLGRALSPVFSRLYGISPAGASALLMGFVGGYPAGAAYIADMERQEMIMPQEAERLLAFCNNSGPAFIVGVMGCAIFGSADLGLRLYAVHIFSALVTGLFFRVRESSSFIPAHRLDSTNTAEAIVAAVRQAAGSIINVCAFVICFSVLLSLLETGAVFSLLCSRISAISGTDESFIRAAFTGFLELGSGAGAMQGMEASPMNLSLAAAILGWGGLSVHFQTLAVLSQSKIKGSLHLAGRLISAVIAFITMYLISR